MAETRSSCGGGQKGYVSRREVRGLGSVLRLIFEPSSPQGSSHNPQFTVARSLGATNGSRGALSSYDGTRTVFSRCETGARPDRSLRDGYRDVGSGRKPQSDIGRFA